MYFGIFFLSLGLVASFVPYGFSITRQFEQYKLFAYGVCHMVLCGKFFSFPIVSNGLGTPPPPNRGEP
nr:MAG TPA: hypothetical protein [Caudoviricetes sp.]